MNEKIDTTMSIVLGAAGGIAIEWDVIMVSAVNAAVAGFVGALFGLFAKWVWKRYIKK